MNYEEKYNQALEIAKEEQETFLKRGNISAKSAIERIFPELHESEDEKIRKEIIQSIQDNMCVIHKDKCLAWLEKQGGKSDYNPYKATVESITTMVEKYASGDLRDFYDNIKVKCKDAMEYDNTWIEKQCEKTIPKNIDDAALQYVDTCAVDGRVTHDNINEPYWNNHSMMAAYKAGWLKKQEEQDIIDLKEYAKGILKGAAIHLMLWIDENLADGKMCLSNMECKDLEDAMVNAKWDKIYNYIKKKVEKQDEQKSWSEEDEYQFNTILHGLDLKRELYKKEGNQVEEKRYKTQYDLLKSLKPQNRWKPSEEQMQALFEAKLASINNREYFLGLLYEDLKKL